MLLRNTLKDVFRITIVLYLTDKAAHMAQMLIVDRQKRIPLFLVILLDIILAALMVLVIFACTFSVKKPKKSEPNITGVLKKIEAGIKAEEREIEQYQKEIDMLSPWQKEFKDKFSEKLISTENSYKSPNISIELETLESAGTVYHLADIYIANIVNFKTYTANGEFKYFSTQNAVLENQSQND